MKVQGKKNEIEEMIEEYVVRFEKAISSGNQEDLPKEGITNLDELNRARQEQALAKASRPSKTATETAPCQITTRATPFSSPIATAEVEEQR